MDLIWSRAESSLYVEPKNLVAHGLATAHEEVLNGRRRTVYTITAKGRRALRDWMAEPTSLPQLESEAMVRTFFAESGEKEDLLATIDALGEFGRSVRERLTAQVRGYLDNDGPFQDRWHLIGLGSRFLIEYAMLHERWARWAREEVSGWPTAGPEARARGPVILRETLRRSRSR